MDYVLLKPDGCGDVPPNNEAPNGEAACVGAGGDPKAPKLAGVEVGSVR